MFNARERPCGRNDKSADVLLDDQLSVHLGKPKVVADAEAKAQISQGKAPESITRNKTVLFFNGRDCIQVSLSIFCCDFSPLIDKDQGIVDRRAILFRYAAHDGNGRLGGDFLKSGHETAGPRAGVIPDCRHRVACVGHLRENNQLHAGFFGTTRKISNLEQVGFWIAERTRNLSGRNLHLNPPTKYTKGCEISYMTIQRLFSLGPFAFSWAKQIREARVSSYKRTCCASLAGIQPRRLFGNAA